MTNSEAISIAMSFNIGVSAGEIIKAAADFDVLDSDTYTSADKERINAIAGTVLSGYLMVKSISQGGFSVAFDLDGIKARIAWLARNSGGLFEVPEELQTPSRRQVRPRNLM